MLRQAELARKLGTVFEQRQAVVLAEVVTDAYSDLVKTGDFNELKSIVKELAEAQKELAEAQKETQYHVQALTHKLGETNNTLGELEQSFAYALENEAYRMIPALLEEKHGIRMTERFVRTYVEGEEINLFGRGRRDGQDILIVGEKVTVGRAAQREVGARGGIRATGGESGRGTSRKSRHRDRIGAHNPPCPSQGTGRGSRKGHHRRTEFRVVALAIAALVLPTAW